MNTILSFMDKLYSDSKTLSMVYVIGAILLFIFVLMLMFSLRKSDKKDKTKIIDEPKIDEEAKKEESVIVENKNDKTIIESTNENDFQEENKLSEQSIFEKTVIIPLDELEKEEVKEANINDALNYADKHKTEEIKTSSEEINEIKAEIPDVDDYVDNIVKKTYEKNEQFSSVYVGNNTSTIKLDKVMEDLKVDENVAANIVPEEEKSTKDKEELIEENKVLEPVIEKINLEENKSEDEKTNEEIKTEPTNSLDNLKKALEEKKQEVNLKQDELKAKLEGLKKDKPVSSDTVKAEDLLQKLNSIKND